MSKQTNSIITLKFCKIALFPTLTPLKPPFQISMFTQQIHELHENRIHQNRWCVLLAQWITWLTRDCCNPKVSSSIPTGGKDFP